MIQLTQNWHLWCVRIAVIHFLLFLKYYSSTSLDVWIQIWRPAPPRLRDAIDGAETIMASRLASPTGRHWRRENKYGVPPRLACGTPLTARRKSVNIRHDCYSNMDSLLDISIGRVWLVRYGIVNKTVVFFVAHVFTRYIFHVFTRYILNM